MECWSRIVSALRSQFESETGRGFSEKSLRHKARFAEAFPDSLNCLGIAETIAVAHNHPTGTLEPSAADVEVTVQIKRAGEIMGLQLLDHIIFNRNAYYSFLESGRL